MLSLLLLVYRSSLTHINHVASRDVSGGNMKTMCALRRVVDNEYAWRIVPKHFCAKHTMYKIQTTKTGVSEAKKSVN